VSRRSPETVERVRAFQSEARECCAQMIANASYMQNELANVRMSDELRKRTVELCADLGGMHFDAFSEISDIDELLERDDGNPDILARINLTETWMQGAAIKMHGIVEALYADSEKDVMKVGAYLLVSESAVNILNPLTRMRQTAAQLRSDLG